MVYVIASLQLRPGTRDAFLAQFARVVPLVLAEEGCLAYVPTVDAQTGLHSQSATGEDCVTVVEQWASLAALKAHDQAEHMRGFRARIKDMLVERNIRMLEPA